MKDIHNAGNMPPNSGILYAPATPQSGDDPASYIGVIRVTEAGLYWVRIWPRKLHDKIVVELKLTPKTN
jgi:hypothetical protein